VRRRTSSGLAALALLTSSCTLEEAARIQEAATSSDDPGESPEGDAGSAPVSVPIDDCTDCHDEVTAEWSASAHRAAFTNDLFQNEWHLHGDPWCVRCHAPAADASAPAGVAATDGISCAVCHVIEGVIVSSRVSGEAPHDVRADPAFGTEAQCAGHSVAFPPSVRVAPGQALQDTISEWQRSGAPGACQDCHMPLRGDLDASSVVPSGRPHRSHLFPGARDDALLSSSLRVTATARCVNGRTRVELRLEAGAVGHDVPTGDVFRRLEVSAALRARPATRLLRNLERRFAVGRDGSCRPPTSVPVGGAREVELVLSGCAIVDGRCWPSTRRFRTRPRRVGRGVIVAPWCFTARPARA
jgi:hypothetical protein